MTPCDLLEQSWRWLAASCVVLLGVVGWLVGTVRGLREELEERDLAARVALEERVGHEVGSAVRGVKR